MNKPRMMKSTLAALSLCSVLSAGWGLTSVGAQPAGAPRAGKKGGAKKGRAKIIKELTQIESFTGPLTAAQRTDITTAIKARDEATAKARDDYMQALAKATKMTPEELAPKLKAARKANGGQKATPAA